MGFPKARLLDEDEARKLVPKWQVPLVYEGESLADFHEAAKLLFFTCT